MIFLPHVSIEQCEHIRRVRTGQILRKACDSPTFTLKSVKSCLLILLQHCCAGLRNLHGKQFNWLSEIMLMEQGDTASFRICFISGPGRARMWWWISRRKTEWSLQGISAHCFSQHAPAEESFTEALWKQKLQAHYHNIQCWFFSQDIHTYSFMLGNLDLCCYGLWWLHLLHAIDYTNLGGPHYTCLQHR